MVQFLISIIDFYDIQKKGEYYVCFENSDDINEIQIEDITNINDPIVTFNPHLLIDNLRLNSVKLPVSIVDISQIAKLAIGLPNKEFEKFEPWNWGQLVINYFEKEEYNQLINLLRQPSKNIENKLFLIKKLVVALKEAYNRLIEKLKSQGEYSRFFSIELPISNILYIRQYKGILVDNGILENKLSKIDNEIFLIQDKLRYEHNIYNIQSSAEIIPLLNTFGLNYAAKTLKTKTYQDILRHGAEFNPLLKLLYSLNRLKQDKSILLKLTNIEKKIYPMFDPIGTITSRILIKQPLIQQLRKNSRNIFQPEPSKIFCYADFGQFEPGILADKAQDENLISCYNAGDVYEQLSIKVFGSKDYRKACKIFFLSYIYGMTKTTLNNLLNDYFGSTSSEISSKIELFFKEFPGLPIYKNEQEVFLLKNGKIGTANGNFRYRTRQKEFLYNYEKRWVLSQKIQGTASLIFKKALIELRSFDEIEFLIPMHDAALFQIPINKQLEYMEIIEKAFKNAFSNECPSIIPKVNFEDFYNDD